MLRCTLAFIVLLAVIAPGAQAWKLTVEVYGAGNVDETTSANFTNCGSTGATTATGVLQASCTEPPAGGGYGGGWVVRLQANPAAGFAFDRWEWATSGVECDDGPNDPGCQWAWAVGPGAGDYRIKAFFKDIERPETSLSGGPAEGAHVQQRDFTFTLGSTQAPGSFRCELDDVDVGCGSVYSTGELPDGPHRFEVWARDASGNEDDDPETRSWTVDNVAPITTVTGGPVNRSRVRDRTATFTLAVNEDVTSLACTLNDIARDCEPGELRLADLEDGDYALAVEATDLAGNVETSTVHRTWTVDNRPPLTTIAGGPANGAQVEAQDARFELSADEPSTFSCVLDGQPLACGATLELTGLSESRHRLEVRATDAAGNVEAVPATRSWTVIHAVVDADGDGSPRGKDCNDADASMRPGGIEIPGNGKDDDCRDGDAPLIDSDLDGIFDPTDACPTVARGAFDADADGCVGPYGTLQATSLMSWEVDRRGVRFTSYEVVGLRRGATITFSCLGKPRRCPIAFSVKAKRRSAKVRRMVGRLFRPRHGFVIVVTAEGMIGSRTTWKVKRPGRSAQALRKFKKKPWARVRRCLPAGSLKPQRTCSATPATGP